MEEGEEGKEEEEEEKQEDGEHEKEEEEEEVGTGLACTYCCSSSVNDDLSAAATYAFKYPVGNFLLTVCLHRGSGWGMRRRFPCDVGVCLCVSFAECVSKKS